MGSAALEVPVGLLGVLLAVGCGPGRMQGTSCGCASDGFGALYAGSCVCMPPVDPDLDSSTPERAFYVDPDVASEGDGSEAAPWAEVDWSDIDAALAQGDVIVYFSAATADGAGPQELPERLDVLRSDTGPHRLILDGRSRTNTDDVSPSWIEGPGLRAIVPGILTPYEGVYHRITVRGFEVTGSRDKGVYWRAGDEVLLTDLDIHDNRGSPAVNLDYSNRSGHASTSFRFVGNHVYNQRGEGIYIGGSEGEDLDSHAFVEVSHNLVHDIDEPLATKDDGINIKDRIGQARVIGNVVYRADWGIEIGSPGIVAHNVILDSRREGLMVNDAFGPVSDLGFEHNLVIRPGHDGVNLTANTGPMQGIVVRGTTVVGAGQAGLKVGGEHRSDVLVQDFIAISGAVGFDGWGEGDARVEGCAVGENERDAAGTLQEVRCGEADVPDLTSPAGADGVWLTADDPGWLVGGAQPPMDQ